MKALLTSCLLILPLWGADFPWSSQVPADIAAASLHQDTVLDEIPCNWRPQLTPIVEPLVKDCTTAREAVLRIAAELSRVTGVYYSTERRKHNMNALEALAEKKVSCTGQSILLVCALRSVGIPARAVGVFTWNHIRGNHTWAEAWFDGAWHMIEFNERDFNTPWVLDNIGMLDSTHPAQRIKAATPHGNAHWAPPSPLFTPLPAEDVTERYRDLALRWYQQNGQDANTQRLLLDISPRTSTGYIAELLDAAGKTIDSAKLPTTADDMRYLARLSLPRQGQFTLRIKGYTKRFPVSASDSAVQILQIAY